MTWGRLLVLAGAMTVVLVFASAAPAPPPTLFSGTNVNITKRSGSDAEATIVINPVNPEQLFFAVNFFTAMRSTDAGATWQPAATKGIDPNAICCDNVAVFDDFGNLFLGTLNFKPPDTVDTVLFFRSTDGGATFKGKKSIDKGDVDQPAIDAGGGQGGSPHSVWMTWNNGGTIFAGGAEVTGLGKLGGFTKPEAAPGSDTIDSGGQFGDVAVGPNGQVLVVWQTSSFSDDCPCGIYANLDPDGLGPLGFGSEVHVTDTNVSKFDALPAQPNRTVDAEANLAWDRSAGPHAGRVYLVYNNESPDESDNFDVWVRYSDNNGATWSSAVKVNDDVGTKSQFLPEIAVDQTTGNLLVTWYDARNSAGNDTFQYFGALSTDGGVTWSANQQISTGTSNCSDSGDGFDCGDYNFVSFSHGVGAGTWADNSNSTGDNPDATTGPLDMYTAQLSTSTAICHGRVATVVGLTGTSGDDVIIGTGGNDTIDGGGGNDVICAGDGNDNITDGDGNDIVYGEGGNDTLDQGAAPNGADIFVGGAGTDTVSYGNRTVDVQVALDGKAKDGEKGEGDNIDAENITTGSGADRLTGDANPNVLTGGPGKDKLSGKDGADTLNGSDGTGGNDSIDCGANDGVVDTFNFDAGPPPDKVKNCP